MTTTLEFIKTFNQDNEPVFEIIYKKGTMKIVILNYFEKDYKPITDLSLNDISFLEENFQSYREVVTVARTKQFTNKDKSVKFLIEDGDILKITLDENIFNRPVDKEFITQAWHLSKEEIISLFKIELNPNSDSRSINI